MTFQKGSLFPDPMITALPCFPNTGAKRGLRYCKGTRPDFARLRYLAGSLNGLPLSTTCTFKSFNVLSLTRNQLS
jgi:hypothetical protein